MNSPENPTRRTLLTATGTALAVTLAGCNDEEDDSPAQGGNTPTQDNAPQEPADNASRGSGTETIGESQREDDGEGGAEGGEEGSGGGGEDTPEGDGGEPEGETTEDNG